MQMANVDIEWKDVEKKLEEDEFKKEKSEQLQQEADTAAEQQSDKKQDKESDYETIGLSNMVSEMWNGVAVEKGYDPVTEKQSEFLQRHTARFEEKYLKDRLNMLPEIEALASHLVVYLPKWLKHKKETKQG